MTVGISVNRSFKSNRDKLSGVLRYAATKPRWTIAILGEAGTKDVKLDALISLYGAPSGMLQGGGGSFSLTIIPRRRRRTSSSTTT